MQDAKIKYGFEPIAIQLHTDEGHIDDDGNAKYNIHFHVVQYNYDFEKDKSILRTMRKQDWKDMQDLAANSFTKVGLNFIRGEAKELTGAEHLKKNDYIIKKQKESIKYHSNILNKMAKEIIEHKSILDILKSDIADGKLEYKKYNEFKVEAREEKRLYEKNSPKWKEAESDYKKYMKPEKQIRANVRNLIKTEQQHLNTLKHLEKEIDNKYTKREQDTMQILKDKVQDMKELLDTTTNKANETISQQNLLINKQKRILEQYKNVDPEKVKGMLEIHKNDKIKLYEQEEKIKELEDSNEELNEIILDYRNQDTEHNRSR